MAKAETKKTLQQFDEELKQLHISGQWLYEGLLAACIGGPKPRGDAFLWPWKLVHEKLLEACDVLEESFTARRSLLFNKPGQIAWAHRHTLAAIRFVIEGDGKVFSVVDGEKCPMEPNDLILTPQWTWYDHQN